MTATRVELARPDLSRSAAARPLPSRPAPAPTPAETRRPDLRLVPPARPQRGAALVVAALLVVCGSLLGTAVLHTMLVSGQRQVDQLDDRIRAAEQSNQSRRLAVAELESPVRVVDEARRAGMVDPAAVTWLTRNPDGTLVAGRTERTDPAAEAEAEAGTDGTVTGPDDVVDSGDAAADG